MAFDVTPPEIVGFSRDRIVWKFESDLAGVVSGSLAQNVLVLTGPIAAGTRVPFRWGDTVLSLMAATTPGDTGAQFPAGNGSGTYATALATWLSKNYFINKNFTIQAATHMGSPALFFYARENGLGYDFNLANFPGGSIANLVPGVANNEPLNPSVYVEVWLGNETGMQYELVYEGAQGLDTTRQASFDVAPILHTHLRPEVPDYALPEAERCIYSTRRYYLRYAYAGGEQFSIGQLETTATHVVTMGGFSELSGGPVSVQGAFKGATAADDRLLMVQDRTRWVRVDEPLYVSWINWRASGLDIHARATITYTDDTTVTTNTATLANVAQYDRLRFGVGFGQLNLAALPKQVKEYTVQLRDDEGPVSEPLRCLVDVSFRQYVRYFAHVNSYGGLEIVKTFGKGSGEWKLFRETAEQVLPYDLKSTDGQFLDWNLKYQETFEVATGFLPKRHQGYFLDFFLSPLKHRVYNGVGYAVNVASESIQHGTDGQNLFGFAFKFQYSRQLDAVSEQDLDTAQSPAQQIPPGVQPAGSIIIPMPGSNWQGIIDPYPIQGSSNPVASGGVWSRLAAKQDIIANGTTAQYLRGDGSLANFSTAVRALEEDPTVPSYAKTLTSKEKVLSDLTTIDGLNSGLDADLWRGQTPGQMTVWKSLQWAAAITLSLSGAVTGSAQIDGSGNVTLATTLTAPGLSGTPNRLAKFSPAGNNAVDSAITEVGGVVSVTGSVQVSDSNHTARYYGKSGVTGNPIALLIGGNGFGGTQILDIGGGTSLAEPVTAIRFRVGAAGALGAGTLLGTWNASGLAINSAFATELLHVGGNIRAGILKLDATEGFAPMVINSSTLVTKLNADLLDGWHGAYYLDAANLNAGIFPIQRHPLSGVAAATFTSVSVNSYGHVTAGTNPTTLAGYGITDAVSLNGSYVNPAWLVSIPASKVTGLPTIPTLAGTAGYLPKFTSASVLGNSLVYDTGTAVGIGTASPQASLHVLGDLWVRNADASYLSAKSTVAGGVLLGFNNTDSLRFVFNDGVRPLVILSSGRVGINNENPTEALQVGGNVKAGYWISAVPQGFAPFQIQSTTLNSNLNADLLDGYHAVAFPRLTESATISGAWTFNTAAPTSTVANNVANDFELATVGWVKSYTTEGSGGGSITDPTPSWVNAITQANITSWNTAHSWGNHNAMSYHTIAAFDAAIAGYQPLTSRLTGIAGLGMGLWCTLWSGTTPVARTLTEGVGILITNPTGALGDPIISLADVHAGLNVNGIVANSRGQVLSIQAATYANNILPLLPASVLHDSRPPAFSAIPALSATAGVAYSFTLNLAPYKTSYHNTNDMEIQVILSKPTWLVTALNGLQAVMTGTPPTSGPFVMVITVADNNGNETTVPVLGTVAEPGNTGEQPVTITAKLFDMATGLSSDVVNGGTYTWHPRFNLRFDSVGPHNQVQQSLTGAGGGTFAWGPDNAQPGGGTAQNSQHWAFGPNGDGSVGGWTPGEYTFSPKALLAGVAKADPVFNFMLVEEQSGGGGENAGNAYFYDDSTDTVLGAIPEGGTSFALPASWDIRYDHGPLNGNSLWMELNKTGATSNPVFARGHGMVANSTGSVFLFDGLNDGTNLGAEHSGLELQDGTYELVVTARMSGTDVNTDSFPLTILSTADVDAQIRAGYDSGVRSTNGNPATHELARLDNEAYGLNTVGCVFPTADLVTDALWDIGNWDPFDHTTDAPRPNHSWDQFVIDCYESGQTIWLGTPLSLDYSELNGNPGITHAYGTNDMHMRADGTPTYQDQGSIYRPVMPCIAAPAVRNYAIQYIFRVMKSYTKAFNTGLIKWWYPGIDTNAEMQMPIDHLNADGSRYNNDIAGPNDLRAPKGDFNIQSINRFKSEYPQYAGNSANDIVNAGANTAMGRHFRYYENRLMATLMFEAAEYCVANIPALIQRAFCMWDAGGFGDGLGDFRKTVAIQSYAPHWATGCVKYNNHPETTYAQDFGWSAAWRYGKVAYIEPSPRGVPINWAVKDIMVQNITRSKGAGVSISLLQGSENSAFGAIATESGIANLNIRPVPSASNIIQVNLNLSDIYNGGMNVYLENQWNAARAANPGKEYVYFHVTDDLAPS